MYDPFADPLRRRQPLPADLETPPPMLSPKLQRPPMMAQQQPLGPQMPMQMIPMGDEGQQQLDMGGLAELLKRFKRPAGSGTGGAAGGGSGGGWGLAGIGG